jgi:hypothetical protein
MTYEATTEFLIKRATTFTVTVKAWKYNDKWNWNTYVTVFKDHPKFNDNDWLKDLPFHCGCTYDKLMTGQPLVIKYDFHKVSEIKKLGSDYNHIHDDSDYHPSPECGVMDQCEREALELIKVMESVL